MRWVYTFNTDTSMYVYKSISIYIYKDIYDWFARSVHYVFVLICNVRLPHEYLSTVYSLFIWYICRFIYNFDQLNSAPFKGRTPSAPYIFKCGTGWRSHRSARFPGQSPSRQTQPEHIRPPRRMEMQIFCWQEWKVTCQLCLPLFFPEN